MSGRTGIEWTDSTWNPIRGCSLVSEGCKNCYAMGVAARFSGPGQAYEGLARRRSNGDPQWTGEVAVIERHMLDPLKWKEPRRIFVNSMSDLFHDSVHTETIDRVFAVMALTPRHTFQVLTKRPARMRSYFADPLTPDNVEREAIEVADLLRGSQKRATTLRSPLRHPDSIGSWPLPNVWLGVSVENQAAADERIPLLLETPAAIRFLSCEPLLGPISLDRMLWGGICEQHSPFICRCVKKDWRAKDSIDWVIVGGESGPHARPMRPDWAIYLASQCEESGVPFFFKQWGEWAPAYHWGADPREKNITEHLWPDGSASARYGKKRAGRELDGRTWDEYPGGAA